MSILKVLIIYLVTSVKCIKVIDKFAKTGPVVDKYCGRYGSCEEGTHVMCKYHDPNNRFGPMCHDPYTNISLNADQKEFILAVVNEVRSRIAMGGDKLRDGSMLPQGYGVMSVAWDDELAEFAQLWANQCIEGYDLCRATSKFPNPGQYMIKNRFQYHTWVPVVYKHTKFNDPHYISAEKINYVVYMTIRRSYHDALQAMSPDIIEQNSGEDAVVASVPAINFLFGMQTHIGCGVSAFKDYEYGIDFMYHERYRRIRNVVLLICNYSERLPKDGKLYLTEPPEGTDLCGCPPGWSGDASCLCREDCATHCKVVPDIVVLPIFKFEDAPPRKFTKYRNYDVNKPETNIFEVRRDPILEEDAKNFDIAEAEMSANLKNKTKEDTFNSRKNNIRTYKFDDDHNIQIETNSHRNVNNEDIHVNDLNNDNTANENVFDLLNKLDDEIENVDIGEREKDEIHENIASIYRILTDAPGVQHYENNDGRRHVSVNDQQSVSAKESFKQLQLFFYLVFVFFKILLFWTSVRNIILKRVIFVIEFIISIKCQNTNTVKVIDRFVKNGYTEVASQYCPAIGVCSEGTHVMCMYYDAENEHGPMCHGVQNVTMMPEFAERILEIINEIRSRTAQGVLHDKDGNTLPRGYGIFKVEWEEELATFAQVWANQCIMAKDRCHASRRFPDPGQIGGVYRFTYDHRWDVISSKKVNIKFTKPGFTHGRVLYAVYYILRTQFSSMLKIITPEIIANITDQSLINNNAYLQLFFGNIRHVGCGVSAFTEYVYTPDKKSIYNSVFLVCNYSQRLHVYDQLYLTEKPDEEDHSKGSGCPPGFAENTDQLCYETVCEKHCKYIPDTVVLPIFDIEDRPYRKKPKYRHYGNISNNMLDLGKMHWKDVSNFNLPEDKDFIESIIKNSVENLTDSDNIVPIRRNQPMNYGRNRRKKGVRYDNVDRNSNYRNKGSRDDALSLLNKLQKLIGNIGTEDKKMLVRDKVGSIYRKLTSSANARNKFNENKINNQESYQKPVPNYRMNVNDNHNTALQTRRNNNINYNQNMQLHAMSNKVMLDNGVTNNLNAYNSHNTAIQTRPINNGNYNQNLLQYPNFNNAMLDNRLINNLNAYNHNTAIQNRPININGNYNQNFRQHPAFNNAILDNRVSNHLNAYNNYNTAIQARPINDINYNQNMQLHATSNAFFDHRNNANEYYANRNMALQTRPVDNRNCNKNIQRYVPNAVVRNSHDIQQNQPIGYHETIINCATDRNLNYNNKYETYDRSVPRKHFGNNDGGTPEVDRLLRYNNLEQYRSTL